MSEITQKQRSTAKIVIWLVVLLVLFLIANPFVKVGAGERGVVLNWGAVSDTVLDEGLHFRIPFMQKVVKMDVTIQKDSAVASAASKDLQSVSTEVTLNYHVSHDKAGVVYQTLRQEFASRIIAPAVQEFVKGVTAKYNAEELVTKREEVKADLRQRLVERLAVNNLIVDEISITDFKFSAAFDQAIEAKVTAEQRALEQANITKQEEEKKKQQILKAEALAEKTRLEAQALVSAGAKDVIEKIKAEASKMAAEKWDGKSMPTTIIVSGGDAEFPLLPMLDLK